VPEKKKMNIENYEPTVSLSRKRINEKLKIRVKDNDNGIPQKVIDKIFQPFFTSKPTEVGTGLGLSISYDIVKAQGGEMRWKRKKVKAVSLQYIYLKTVYDAEIIFYKTAFVYINNSIPA
jgi:C4-dicarboxylate-specific signal transduction histidine kinase